METTSHQRQVEWLATFANCRGFKHMGYYKPMQPIELGDGVTVVPAGWGHDESDGASIGVRRSYFIGPRDVTEGELRPKFRDWIAFHDFVMHDISATFYDLGRLPFEKFTYSVDEGVPGDLTDASQAADFSNVSKQLLDLDTSQQYESSISYLDLFARYRRLDNETKESIEWMSSHPSVWVRAKRVDAFSSSTYWRLLHSMVLVERLVGLPPMCRGRVGECSVCGRQAVPHHSVSRRKWLISRLKEIVEDEAVVEQYAEVIEQVRDLRNKLAHKPHLSRARHRPAGEHGAIETYDYTRTAAEYQTDADALMFLDLQLRQIARALLVAKAFGLSHFREPRKWMSQTIRL